MLLTIDVGNTQTVFGIFDEQRDTDLNGRALGEMPGLTHHWRVSTDRDRTGDEWAMQLAQLLHFAGLSLAPLTGSDAIGDMGKITGIAISSSVPSVTLSFRTMLTGRVEVPLVIVQPGIKTGMPILYDNPKEVGADRIVNAVGAIDLYRSPIIVVDLGTATTFDAISAAGEYLGGAIVPGIEISMDALFTRAAALRRVELVAPKRAVGRTTIESMQSGVIYGCAALVDGLVARFIAEIGEATVIATGGLGELIVPHALSVHCYEPWLTLHGLRLLFWRNQEESETRP
jgi:type III pantothenate kinase